SASQFQESCVGICGWPLYCSKGRTDVFRWNDIESLWQIRVHHRHNGMTVIHVHKYIIEDRAGRKVMIDKTYDKIAELGGILQTKVSEAKLPAAVEALQRGETVRFGRLGISQAGLFDGKQLISW